MKDYTKLSPQEKDVLIKKAMDVGFPKQTSRYNNLMLLGHIQQFSHN